MSHALSKPSVGIRKDSDAVAGSTATDSGSDRIGLGEVVSRGIDDGPMPKDRLDVECFEYLMKGFRGLQ